MRNLLQSPRFQISLTILFIAIVYLWFFTAGLWIALPKGVYTNMYDQLATGFCQGKLHLNTAPSQELLSLSDPYDPKERSNISYIGDASLYRNQYYLYWGPVPAAFLCGIKLLIYRGTIGDEYLVFVSIFGILISLALLIYEIRKRFFRTIPLYLLIFGILIAGLANPLTWMLNSPDIYEAGIACGQFFLIAGIYFIFVGFEKKNKSLIWRVLIGAICLSLSIGSRFTQILPAGVISIATLIWYYQEHKFSKPWKKLLTLLMVLASPPLLMGIVLAWYNYARFGAVSEFGLRYQLAFVNMHKQINYIFSPLYIFPNLYNYLLNPFITIRHFPYILPQYGKVFRSFPIPFPKLYFSEATTGLLFISPILLFVFYALISLPKKNLTDSPATPNLQWLKLGLATAALTNIAILLCFFDAAERYSVEMICLSIPLAIIGIWEGYIHLSDKPLARKLYLVFTFCVGGISILNSSLLAISSVQDRFLNGNPALMEKLTNFLIH